MKKIFRFFVIFLITSTIVGKNYSSKSKTNEIYFTITKERQENGNSKIKIVFPLSVKENAISKDNFYLEHKTDKSEYLGNVNKPMSNKESNLDPLMLNSKPSPKNTNNYKKNIGKHTLSKRIGDNTAEFVPSENEQLRFKKEVGKYDTKFIPNEYRYQDPLTGSYGFGYKTQNQYREEVRTADGTVRGNFGWVDDTGKWHHTIFIADKYGYRINTPENIINNHHSSNIPAASLTSASKKESTYLSYSDGNEASYKRKVTRIEPSQNEQKNDSGLPQKKYPEEPLLINLKQKLGIKPPVVSSGSTKQNDDNSTYLSYVKAEANLNQNETSKTPQHNTESLVSNVTPTKIPSEVKPTTHETITVTNLQDNFFNKLPLKPQKENVSPPLDKPFKMFSNYLTKWPNMSWPKPSDPDLEQILGNLQGLSGRSNSFTDSELNFQTDYSRLDESKMAKSIYDSPLSKNFNKDKKTENVKRTRSETSNRSPYLYSYGDPQRSDNFNPYFVDTPKTIGYNSPSLQIVPYKQNSMYLPYNHVFDKTFVLIIPVFYALYPLIPVQNMNLANPNWFHNQFMNPVQPPNYVNALNDMQDLSPTHNLQNLIDSSNEKEKDESQEDDEDSQDYLLLSNEFQEINGSITNDPAFGNIQDFFGGTNDSKFLQNISFEKPINILTSDLPPTISKVPMNLTEPDESDENDDDNEDSDDMHDDNESSNEYEDIEQDDDDDDDDHLNPRLMDTIVHEETNTHKEITFRLSTPLIRNNFPVLLNEH